MDKLKVSGIPWHVANQYEIAKMSWIKTYDLLLNPFRRWGETHRPFPEKCKWVTHYAEGYDLMIAHVDQQSIYDPAKGDRISKGLLFKEAVESFRESNPGKPIVVINHMTPFHDKYESQYVIDHIKKMTEGCHMVCNSYQAAEQWGWGTPIIHGMGVDEWFDRPKEPRVIVVLSSGGMEKAYRRIFLHAVMRLLSEKKIPFRWVGTDIKFKTFEEYRDYLGRSLIFLDPTWQSPRPRAKTEAMLSGCCVVTTPYHMRKSKDDHSNYMTDGVNGFLTSRHEIMDPRIIDNPQKTAELIEDLIFNRPGEAVKIGQAGKKLARKLFNKAAFEKQWEVFLKGLGVL